MKIKVLLTKEQEFEVREQDIYNLIIRNIEVNERDQHDPKAVNDYLYLIPDMLRVAIRDRFDRYYKDNYDIFSLKDQVETVREVQEQVLSIHREKIAEYTIKIYGAKGHLYMQHTVKEADGWPLYGGEYLIDDARRWTLDWAKGIAEKHFKENYKHVEQ